jgi:hypothetical protein
MRYFLAACALAGSLNAAYAHDFKMRAGQDAFVFDYNFLGKTINVYESLPSDKGKPEERRRAQDESMNP